MTNIKFKYAALLVCCVAVWLTITGTDAKNDTNTNQNINVSDAESSCYKTENCDDKCDWIYICEKSEEHCKEKKQTGKYTCWVNLMALAGIGILALFFIGGCICCVLALACGACGVLFGKKTDDEGRVVGPQQANQDENGVESTNFIENTEESPTPVDANAEAAQP